MGVFCSFGVCLVFFFLFGDQSYPILFKINYLSVCAILFLFFYSQNTKCKNIIYLFLFGDLVVHFHFCCRIFFCFLIFFCLHLPFSTELQLIFFLFPLVI